MYNSLFAFYKYLMKGGYLMENASTIPVAFTNLLTLVWTQVDTAVSTITGNPILLIPVGFVFAGGVIGIAKSLMGTRRRGRR